MRIEPDIYGKEGIVLIVQTDHISGETIGTAIGDLYEAGAFNVQVIPTVTKKNRPGCLFFIDGSRDDVSELESVILNELGATGWHLIETSHRHVATDVISREVVFRTPEGDYIRQARGKVIRQCPERIRPEHSDCLEIREELRKKGVKMSLNEVTQEIFRQMTKEN